MTIHINEVLPLLETISRQQKDISARLAKLIEIFRHEPEPVEPTLRSMLKPLREGMDDMREALVKPNSSS
ncbi:hypothetical protein ACZ75_06795 [Massilia sp. NR 4-1]|nr:hypothetical protein ACZ75_06795 [Massilia sp. NR 4-1]